MLIRKRAPVVSEATQQSSGEGKDYVLSTNHKDAYGDIVEQVFDLVDFRNNPIALFNHNPDFPIGKWVNVRISNNKLLGTLKLARRGISTRLDEIIGLVDAGILRAVSIGFLPEEYEKLPLGKGVRYLRSTLKEVSLVSIPANAHAVEEQAKELGVSDATIRVVTSQPRNASLAERQLHAAATLARMDERSRKNLADHEANRRLARMDERSRKNLADLDANRRELAERIRKESAARSRTDPKMQEIDFNVSMDVGVRTAGWNRFGNDALDAAEDFVRETLERIADESHHAKTLREAAAVREYWLNVRRRERE